MIARILRLMFVFTIFLMLPTRRGRETWKKHLRNFDFMTEIKCVWINENVKKKNYSVRLFLISIALLDIKALAMKSIFFCGVLNYKIDS